MNVRTTDITKSSYHLFDVFAFTCCEETPSWEEVHFNASHNRRLWLNVKLWRSRNRFFINLNQTTGMKEKLELLWLEPLLLFKGSVWIGRFLKLLNFYRILDLLMLDWTSELINFCTMLKLSYLRKIALWRSTLSLFLIWYSREAFSRGFP